MAEVELDATFQGNQQEVKKGFWAKVKETAGRVPFIPDAIAMYYCALDPKTPFHAKVIAFTALAYFINPADAVPDPIPLAGYADDAGAIAAALGALIPFVTEEHQQRAADWLADKPAQLQ